MTIVTILISIAVLLIALWISVMALWWHNEQGHVVVPMTRTEALRQMNKATRLARRSWYGTTRYSKQIALWGNKKVRNGFITIFPKSRAAFTTQNALTGLEHGASSYFLASLSKVPKKKTRTKKAQLSEE